MKRNETIDIIRVLASFAVVLCHVVIPGKPGLYAMSLARFAVPFFLMVSGWFLWRQNEEEEKIAVKRFLFTKVRLFLISVILIGTVNSFICLTTGKLIFEWLFTYWSRKDAVFTFVIYNRCVFLNSAVYYLLMVIYVAGIYLWLLTMKRIEIAYLFIFPLIMANIVRGELMTFTWYKQGNWLYTGIPFVFLGRLSHERNIPNRIPVGALWGMVAFGSFLTLIETRWIEGAYLYVGTILLSFGVFGLGIQYKEKVWPSWIAKYGRHITPFLFLAHCTVRDIVYEIISEPQGTAQYIMPVFVFCITSILAECWMSIRDKIKIVLSD